MLDSKLTKLKNYFGISKPEDWQTVEPAWILRMDGVGNKTLDYIRLLLANRGLTLRNDATPGYWKQHLDEARILNTLGDDDDGPDRAVICPFTVLIDTAEQQPFTFAGLFTDASEPGGRRPLIVPTDWRALGRHPDSLGDYSVDGYVGRVHVERKSMSDLHGTVLGFKSERRERFECELGNLSEIDAALVVVECGFDQALAEAPDTDKRSARENAKILNRSLLSYFQDYSVRWLFAGTRELAEANTFRFLERYVTKQREAEKREAKKLNLKSA